MHDGNWSFWRMHSRSREEALVNREMMNQLPDMRHEF